MNYRDAMHRVHRTEGPSPFEKQYRALLDQIAERKEAIAERALAAGWAPGSLRWVESIDIEDSRLVWRGRLERVTQP